MNGYTIYQLTARDESKGNGTAGNYHIYFSSDIRDFGREYSDPEFEDIDSWEMVEELVDNKCAIAKELCEQESTCVSYEDIEKMQERLEAGVQAKPQAKDSKEDLQYYISNIEEALEAGDLSEDMEAELNILLDHYSEELEALEKQEQEDKNRKENNNMNEEGRRKYDIYREMMDDIPNLEKLVREYLTRNNMTEYGIFFSVADEDNRLYFCDIEYGNGEPHSYRRIYKRLTKEALVKFFGLTTPVKVSSDSIGIPAKYRDYVRKLFRKYGHDFECPYFAEFNDGVIIACKDLDTLFDKIDKYIDDARTEIIEDAQDEYNRVLNDTTFVDPATAAQNAAENHIISEVYKLFGIVSPAETIGREDIKREAQILLDLFERRTGEA